MDKSRGRSWPVMMGGLPGEEGLVAVISVCVDVLCVIMAVLMAVEDNRGFDAKARGTMLLCRESTCVVRGV